jgi:small subunit ribosomal protein S15
MTTDKKEIIEKYREHEKDTGSASVQIALLTTRISGLTGHLNKHKKDFSTRRSLLKLAGQRRRLMKYFNRINPQAYTELIKNLELK